ncbi:hypothetical protein L5515_009677 [Caenorhabditis briggsae]|uniref:Uncharacterized protein n=1 Tax=Caenorhabditis briggsae TaxID=6238 RepID=A0AAE9JP09_CAEBR|nr:hypothetical protein L5515_009677 [Caenorhabditis briggsae]
MIRFMNVNNLNPKSAVFQERIRQNLANAFISTTILSAIPGIMMAVPIGLTFGGFYFKIQNLAENRQFVMEIKEIFEKNGEEKIVEKSDSEILIIRKGGVVWANSGF